MPTKRKSKGAYMISAVAEMYEIHPQTLRLYEREGLLKPSRTEGNTRLYTDEDLERLEFILNLARDLGVNIAGIAIILQMRERMEEMNRQMQSFVDYVRTEMLSRMQQGFGQESAIVAMQRRVVIAPDADRTAGPHAAIKGLPPTKPRAGAPPAINAVLGGRRS
jgi:MerR family transcriptional regulator, heat shock protein HspR